MKKRLTLTLNQELSKNILKSKADVLVVGVNEDRTLNSSAKEINFFFKNKFLQINESI